MDVHSIHMGKNPNGNNNKDYPPDMHKLPDLIKKTLLPEILEGIPSLM